MRIFSESIAPVCAPFTHTPKNKLSKVSLTRSGKLMMSISPVPLTRKRPRSSFKILSVNLETVTQKKALRNDSVKRQLKNKFFDRGKLKTRYHQK